MSSHLPNGASIYDAGQPSQAIQDVLNDPAASTWLKDALRGALRRDPVDAANDSAFLAELLDTQAQAAVFGCSPAGAVLSPHRSE